MAVRAFVGIAGIALFAAAGSATAQEVPTACVAEPTVQCIVDAAVAASDTATVAIAMLHAGELERAFVLDATAVSNAPDILAMAEARRGNAPAVNLLLDAIDRDLQILALLGLSMGRMGDIDGARAAFAQAEALAGGEADALLLIAFLQGYIGDADGSRAVLAQINRDDVSRGSQSLYAATLVVTGDPAAAQAYFEAEIASDSTEMRAEGLTAMGVASAFGGDNAAAMALFAQVAVLFAGDRDDLLELGRQQATAGMFKEAVATGLTTVTPEGYNGAFADFLRLVARMAVLADRPDIARGLIRAQSSYLVGDYFASVEEAMVEASLLGADLAGAAAAAAAIEDVEIRGEALAYVVQALAAGGDEIGRDWFPY